MPPFIDPEAPPRRTTAAVLETSILIEDPSTCGDEMAVQAYERYQAAIGRPLGPAWYLRARALDAIRSDGQPFYVSDILALTAKDGRQLGRNSAYAKLAERFLELGLSASYLRVGSPESAVGKVFLFEERDIPLGNVSKRVRLWPVQLLPDDYKPERVREVPVEPGAPSVPPAPSPPDDIGRILVEALSGAKAEGTEVFDRVIGDSRLRTAGVWKGVSVLEGAVDGSLVDTLIGLKLMKKDADGRLLPA